MEQVMQIGNSKVNMSALPTSRQGKAYFTFIKSPSVIRSFWHDQASFLGDPPVEVFLMLSSIWGRIDDLPSFVNLQNCVAAFCRQAIQQRNGLGVGLYICIFSQTAGILLQQPSINTNIRGEMIDEGLGISVSEQGVDQTAIAKLERVDAAGVLDHDDRCSICFEGFKEIMGDMGMARTPCSHLFHYGCIVQWLKMRETCPLCRRDIC